VGIEERRSSAGQAVNIRCLGHGMSTKCADPIVLVVDGDEQDIRSILGGRRCRANADRADYEKNAGESLIHWVGPWKWLSMTLENVVGTLVIAFKSYSFLRGRFP
jgi:hypothetical protein